jgi:hypothetical protein
MYEKNENTLPCNNYASAAAGAPSASPRDMRRLDMKGGGLLFLVLRSTA